MLRSWSWLKESNRNSRISSCASLCGRSSILTPPHPSATKRLRDATSTFAVERIHNSVDPKKSYQQEWKKRVVLGIWTNKRRTSAHACVYRRRNTQAERQTIWTSEMSLLAISLVLRACSTCIKGRSQAVFFNCSVLNPNRNIVLLPSFRILHKC